jgi:hypothetical protein
MNVASCVNISGRSVRTMAKARRTTVSAINEAIDRWALPP